jgi:hypothetical protein
LRDVPNSYNIKRSYLENQLNEIQILVLGSSETLWGVNPSCFELKAFNVANISQSLYYDDQLMEKYIDRLPSLKIVIITISYFSLGYQLNNSENWRDYFYYHFWGIHNKYISCVNPNTISLVSLYSVPTTREYLFKGFDVKLTDSPYSDGWVEKNSIYNSVNNPLINDSVGYLRVNVHNSMLSSKNYYDNTEILDNMLHILRNRKIEPVLITIPVYKTYSKYVDSIIDSRNKNIINKLCDKHKCRYFNYFTDYRFTINDFFDNDHLNSRGAQKFSKILNEDLKRFITE